MRGKRVAVAALLVATAGCATTRYAWDYDADTDFDSYVTFDWMPAPSTVTQQRQQLPLLELRLKRSFEHELQAIGYEKVDEDPDFYVAFHTAVDRTLTRTYFNNWRYRYPPRGAPWRGRPGPRAGVVVVDSYDVGSLILDVIDADTEELVWRGVATGFPYGGGTPDRDEAEATARAILEGFPPVG